ncbi:MAG: nucleotidyltransferase family protein [Bacillota bacterium]
MEMPTIVSPDEMKQQARAFYLDALAALDRSQVPYLVGGGYAMTAYTGITRQTKDLDLFVRAGDSRRALDVLGAAGYRTEVTWSHFLVKALYKQAFVDILHNSGNGLSPVDDQWFAHAVEADVLGRRVLLCPAEEILWTKAFVQDRDRFDGADVAHLILARGEQFDWQRLIRRFQSHERVLLAHLLLYTYIYPSERRNVPGWVMEQLMGRMAEEPASAERVCMGTFLSQKQFLFDVNEWGYADARLQPRGPLTPAEIAELPAA